MMSATMLLKLQMSQRLEAAVEEIFELVEKTLSEYQEETVRSKREILQLRGQIEQLTVLKPRVVLFSADAHLPQQLPELPVLGETEIHEVKQEEVYQYINADVEADSSKDGESKPVPSCEMLTSSTAETLSVNQSKEEEGKERDGSLLPSQSDSVEVFKELEQPSRDKAYCRLCGEQFIFDAHLRRHVDESHKGNKAFKCMHCNKEFDQRHHLIMHIRIHTGEKPFTCDYCDKSFVQNSCRVVHMRLHTGEKPYFCKSCNKSYRTSTHFKLCEMRKKRKIAKEKQNEGKDNQKHFKCHECNKEFNRKHQLVLHARVHTNEKPFSCDLCHKTFRYNFNCLAHMRRHTENPKKYFCEKCDKTFACSTHLTLCKGAKGKSEDKSFRCSTCGRTFYTDSDLKVHMEVHESWKLHISEKRQGQNV
ncbi:zinc finger protein OZF-like [Eleginops maclovinus]|uniref:zinc finger protein OZF-like n=1 Tax=Eleginops maclovinus TaxID=56733 RepID=UPI0030803D8A